MGRILYSPQAAYVFVQYVMIQVVHAEVQGRVRFHIPELYRCESLKKFLQERLSRYRGNGISSFSPNILTGNALVCFNTDNSPETIGLLLEQCLREYHASTGSPQPDPKTGKSVIDRQVQDDSFPSPPTVGQGEPVAAFASAWREQEIAPWHTLETEEILARWSVSRETGLAQEVAQGNYEKFGPNALSEPEPRSGWEIFISQFKSLPVALLSAAAGLAVISGGILDAVLIMGVVAVNAGIAYKTESEAETTIQSLKNLIRPTAQVIRNGDLQEIAVEGVVPGDLLSLKPGTYIAADSRLVEADRLSVDESALTGESLPALKTTQVLKAENIPLGDRTNMVYRGAMVTGGQGLALVVATGRYTEIGKLQTLVEEAVAPETPLEKQLGRVGDELVLLCCGICALVCGIGLLRGFALLQMANTAVSLAAAAVPEGLPTVATTTLALGVKNMEKHQVLIRRLEAVETLGCLQTVCLDKTGTITKNEMTVVRIYAGGRVFQFNEEDLPAAVHQIASNGHEFAQLIRMAALCNETEIDWAENRYVLSGSATEKALVQLAIDLGIDVLDLRRRYPLLRVNHRSEQRPFMTTYHETATGDKLMVLKGSPLDVLAMCDTYLKEGQRLPLNVRQRLQIETENDRMAGDSLRVLGVAVYHGEINGNGLDAGNDRIDRGFTWLGVTGMADPIREGVHQLVSDFHRAGIRTVMITGDQSQTAYAIGKELNLSQGEPLEILDSTHLDAMAPETIKALAQRVHIFARVSPAHKLQIVRALQSAGQVVAMTGDGINDGPALKAAEVGIAMGHSGTDIAREVADVVLKEDNLETLVVAIQDGRTSYSNIKKSVHFFLSTNISEIMVTFMALAAGWGTPLNTMQLLWINLVSDILPGLALTMEAPEPSVLERPPRPTGEPIFSGDEYWSIMRESATLSAAALSAYGYGLMRYGIGARAGALAFNSLTIAQLLHAFSCRSDRQSVFRGNLPANRFLTLSVGGSILLQVLAMFTPGLRSLLGIGTMSLTDGVVIAGTSLMPLIINELIKK